jgi:hypothetical protein
LEKYIEIVKSEFPEYTRIPVLLTLEIDEASDIAEEIGTFTMSLCCGKNVPFGRLNRSGKIILA